MHEKKEVIWNLKSKEDEKWEKKTGKNTQQSLSQMIKWLLPLSSSAWFYWSDTLFGSISIMNLDFSEELASEITLKSLHIFQSKRMSFLEDVGRNYLR